MKKIRRQVITNKTKFFIPLLLLSLTLLFCVDTVSATGSNNTTLPSDNLTVSDVQTTSNSSNSTTNNSSDSENNQTLPDPQVWRGGIQVGPNYTTIQDAIDNAIDGDTIMLENGQTFSGDGNTRITISKDLNFDVMDGGTATIDGEGTRWGFVIFPGRTVTFNHIIFQNLSSSGGGAIRNFGTLTVNGSTFTDNRALDRGGAIYSEGGSLTVNGSTFTGNTADYGGAIYNDDSTLTVTGCTFTGNTADFGGAIWNDGGAIYDDSTSTINGSTFTDNTARNGGAIFNYNWGTLNVNNSTFTGNNATYGGGAIRNFGTLTVNDSTFTDNTARNGGAIYNEDDLTVTGSTFTRNTADWYGGAIYNYDTLAVTDSTFDSNTASYGGGAIRNFGILTVTGSTFTGNTSTGGGAIENRGILTVTGSTFDSNTASYDGGALSNWVTLTVTGSTFTRNTADWYGGAIYNEYSGDLTINASEFTDNTAETGGAIFNAGTLTISDAQFNQNSAEAGGAIYNYGALTVNDSTFTDNGGPDTTFGGAIYNANIPSTVSNCAFDGNDADYGGAIYNQSELTITDSEFTDNTADAGGAIYNYGDLTVNFCRIVGNTANQGSAIYNNGGAVNATLNWWGSNTDPATIPNLIVVNDTSSVDASTWVILTVNANPAAINNGETSTITADFNHINGGDDLVGGHIPDGPITLSIPWGSFTNPGITHSFTANTVAGVMTATFYANEGAVNHLFNPVMVTATSDGYTTNETESAYITINKTSDLYIKITSNENNPKVDETFTLTYKLGNKGPDAAQNVTITIPLPEGFEYINISGDGVWTYNETTRTITWTLTSVPVGDPYLYISGYVNKPGVYVFGSSISSETYNINSEGVTSVTINAVSQVKAASKTVPMQRTGLPVNYLILAILMVIGGFLVPIRR